MNGAGWRESKSEGVSGKRPSSPIRDGDRAGPISGTEFCRNLTYPRLADPRVYRPNTRVVNV